MTPVAALPCAPQPGPTAGLNSWLLRKPRPAGFCLIVPDNPAALEIAAGASGAELLREHIQEFLCNRFGPENVGTHGAGFVIALAGLDLLGTVDRSVQEIAELRLEGRARSCAITASAGVLWLDDDMAVE